MTNKGFIIYEIASQFGFHQVKSEPTHLNRKKIFFHIFSIYSAVKFINAIWSKLFTTRKLPSSNNLCKSSLFTWPLVLSKGKHWIYQKNDIWICMGHNFLEILRSSFSDFYESRFRHNFQDTLNPIRSCGETMESITHYLVHCLNQIHERMTLLKIL